jgi:hypothetical protein
VEGRLDLFARQALGHQMEHAQGNPCLTGGGQEVILFAHAPVATDPGKSALDDPTARRGLEAGRRLPVLAFTLR